MEFVKVYKDTIDALKPSEELMKKLYMTKEESVVRINKKRVVVLAMAACLLLGTAVFAAGKIEVYRGSASPKDEITDYDQAASKAKELDDEIAIPKAFSNGYTFSGANTISVEGLDENDRVIAEGDDFSATYERAGDSDITLFVNSFYEDEEAYAIDFQVINGVEVFLQRATYKFVPADYELTEEDIENEKDPSYKISYGASSLEEKQYDGISFTLNGVHYSMFGWNTQLTAEEWYGMATDLLAK